MFTSSWLSWVGGFSLSLASLAYGQQTILEQNFDTLQEGLVGRFGSANPGPNPYGLEGRWSEFGVDPGTPRIQVRPDGVGQVVALNRLEEARPLIGAFNPIQQAVSRLVLECDMWLSLESAMVVSINGQNTQAASVLLRTQPPGAALWNPRELAWEPTADRAPAEQWFRLIIDCDFQNESYKVTFVDQQGNELFSAHGLLNSATLQENPLNNVLFNPQPGSSDECLIDQVVITAWF